MLSASPALFPPTCRTALTYVHVAAGLEREAAGRDGTLARQANEAKGTAVRERWVSQNSETRNQRGRVNIGKEMVDEAKGTAARVRWMGENKMRIR